MTEDENLTASNDSQSAVDKAVEGGSSYDVIRKRLKEQANTLEAQTKTLNTSRTEEFGSAELKISARTTIRTDNNCIARDIVQVGDALLFGYNVFIGLKKTTKVQDVFSLFSLENNDGKLELTPRSIGESFLNNRQFEKDFFELYEYYKNTRLIELTVKDGKLLMGFQIGERPDDIRVFRWAVSADGKECNYIDNRGERDIQLPPRFDFEWHKTEREDTVHGRHPHVNIADTIFVDCLGGNLTIKIEDNTNDGLGIYQEQIEEKNQSIDDAKYHYAKIGELILLSVQAYKEEKVRYFVYSILTQEVVRIDRLGLSCVLLPEDHGVIFPGGYFLQTGEYKLFANDIEDLRFKRVIRAPNGEDVLFVFYEREAGIVTLYSYSVIEKKLASPILGNGYALSEDGTLVVFSAEEEPTRVHPMQLWTTPYIDDTYAAAQVASQSFLGRVGNPELVRGISALLNICRFVQRQTASLRIYQELQRAIQEIFDHYYWLSEPETEDLSKTLKAISETADLVIDEYAKVESIRNNSQQALQEARSQAEALISRCRGASWDNAEEYIEALNDVRKQRGHLVTISEYRYIDTAAIKGLDENLSKTQQALGEQTLHHLSDSDAMLPYREKVAGLELEIEGAESRVLLLPIKDDLGSLAEKLDTLNELLSGLKVEDAKLRTAIVDAITEVYAQLNQAKARLKNKEKTLGLDEAVLQFSSQFKLLSQSIAAAINGCETPDECDEQMSRLLVQLEDLESHFSEFEQFLPDILAKREEIYSTFETRKQQLVDERQSKAAALSEAGKRLVASIEKRCSRITEIDELNTFFGSDALVRKVAELVEQLHLKEASVQAEDLQAQFNACKEQALRILRDKADLYEDGGKIVRLGRQHRFTVNTQALEVSIVPKEENLYVHLNGTEFFEKIDNESLNQLKPYWHLHLESESEEVYRAEYLAAEFLRAAERKEEGVDLADLKSSIADKDSLVSMLRKFAQPRYHEGYDKGVHDYDAALIVQSFLPLTASADLLRFSPLSRGFAQVFWANIDEISLQLERCRLNYETWRDRAVSASGMKTVFHRDEANDLLGKEVADAMREFLERHPIAVDDNAIHQAAMYLVAEMGREQMQFIVSKHAQYLADELQRSMNTEHWHQFQQALAKMSGWPAERWALSIAWLKALVEKQNLHEIQDYISEAAALINADQRVDRRHTEVDLACTVQGLLGQHPRIENGALKIKIDEFSHRLFTHKNTVVPAIRKFKNLRSSIAESIRYELRIDEFKARPLSSFVRNRLIDDAYLSFIGDNFAKQMGAAGSKKRSDLMGLLMMISPPGYGKTTLMEYVASRLGLTFMKVNCPALGHDVVSLDPQQAPNATAKQELEKLNLAFEMSNNVMLYLDDIQHTHPEFLQKFISLCDGTRRIEGVWRGRAKTYDMRGKKFCVVMAGNPYTESGEVFKIPDMLANRADIYNLGDILGGYSEQFASSYIENCLTSNVILAPLATRNMKDVYAFIDMAVGRAVGEAELSYPYSAAESDEICKVLTHLFTVRDVVMKVNQQYILSAAQDDRYRTEPPFKLQGSYRNMNKMAEKISPIMEASDIEQVIDDHYQGESQLLTSGAEENILKLAELRGKLSEDQETRWQEIKADFVRHVASGGDNSDAGQKLAAQLYDINHGIQHLSSGIVGMAESYRDEVKVEKAMQKKQLANHAMALERLDKLCEAMSGAQTKVEVINEPVPGINKVLTALADSLEHSIMPLVRNMDKKLDIDLNTHEKMTKVADNIRRLEKEIVKLGARKATKKSDP